MGFRALGFGLKGGGFNADAIFFAFRAAVEGFRAWGFLRG